MDEYIWEGCRGFNENPFGDNEIDPCGDRAHFSPEEWNEYIGGTVTPPVVEEPWTLVCRRPNRRRPLRQSTPGGSDGRRIVTINGTNENPIKEALLQVSKDSSVVACLGQEHRLGKDDLQRLVSWGRSIGWKIIASAANLTLAGDTSGGTFVALRSFVNYTLWPGAVDDDGTLLAGRATGVIANVFGKGGIGLISVYLETGAGVRGNKEAMATL
jgi:hypothetical protein